MEDKAFLLGIYLYFKGSLSWSKLFEGDIEKVCAEKKIEKRKLKELGEKELEKAFSLGIKVVFKEESDFPSSLKEIPYSPPFLYIKGELKEIPLIAVVGSRKATSYGREVAKFITKGLVESGVGIVSGLARGIDSIAHKTTLSHQGYTVAVLGCGLDVIYPPENKDLFEEIGEKGAVISEFPLGTKPRKENFPRRNRLISGLSKGVLVVEAGEKSGTLITAKWALSQGKDIFCIPGSIFSPLSKGTHLLLKEGAILVDSPEDVLFYLGLQKNFSSEERQTSMFEDELSEKEKCVVSNLSHYPVHIDELVERTGLSSFELSSLLSELELMDIIEVLPGKFVKLKT